MHTHFTLLDRARRRRFRPADRARRRCWPTCRPPGSAEHLQLRAVAGLRLRGELPESAATVTIDLKEIGRLLRAAAGLRGPAHQRDDPHGGRRGDQARDVPPSWRGWRAWPLALMDGKPAGMGSTACLRAGQPDVYGPLRNTLGFRACAWPTRRARRSARPVPLLPLDRHQPQAALRPTETAVFVCLQPDHEAAPTRWARPSPASRSSSPTAARSWSSRPGCSRSTTRTPPPPPRC